MDFKCDALKGKTPVPAREYDKFLAGLGLIPTNTSIFILGDIGVFEGYPGGTSDVNGVPYVHIQMFNGSQWISNCMARGSIIFYDYTSDGRIDHITTILNSSKMLHPSSGAGVLQIQQINYLDSYTNNRGGTIYYREFNWLIINKNP